MRSFIYKKYGYLKGILPGRGVGWERGILGTTSNVGSKTRESLERRSWVERRTWLGVHKDIDRRMLQNDLHSSFQCVEPIELKHLEQPLRVKELFQFSTTQLQQSIGGTPCSRYVATKCLRYLFVP